eukprot:TRINITY_DN9789_c0_g1_i1.p1 TRINITY_DN9789_c0_g1~~TRINITY_DN9789_c0_g1_i1.p1  ORF type:complete len:967 (+),score=294.40 TRINITY_DN9789_c0_g1_i1:50-2902(+)
MDRRRSAPVQAERRAPLRMRQTSSAEPVAAVAASGAWTAASALRPQCGETHPFRLSRAAEGLERGGRSAAVRVVAYDVAVAAHAMLIGCRCRKRANAVLVSLAAVCGVSEDQQRLNADMALGPAPADLRSRCRLLSAPLADVGDAAAPPLRSLEPHHSKTLSRTVTDVLWWWECVRACAEGLCGMREKYGREEVRQWLLRTGMVLVACLEMWAVEGGVKEPVEFGELIKRLSVLIPNASTNEDMVSHCRVAQTQLEEFLRLLPDCAFLGGAAGKGWLRWPRVVRFDVWYALSFFSPFDGSALPHTLPADVWEMATGPLRQVWQISDSGNRAAIAASVSHAAVRSRPMAPAEHGAVVAAGLRAVLPAPRHVEGSVGVREWCRAVCFILAGACDFFRRVARRRESAEASAAAVVRGIGSVAEDAVERGQPVVTTLTGFVSCLRPDSCPAALLEEPPSGVVKVLELTGWLVSAVLASTAWRVAEELCDGGRAMAPFRLVPQIHHCVSLCTDPCTVAAPHLAGLPGAAAMLAAALPVRECGAPLRWQQLRPVLQGLRDTVLPIVAALPAYGRELPSKAAATIAAWAGREYVQEWADGVRDMLPRLAAQAAAADAEMRQQVTDFFCNASMVAEELSLLVLPDSARAAAAVARGLGEATRLLTDRLLGPLETVAGDACDCRGGVDVDAFRRYRERTRGLAALPTAALLERLAAAAASLAEHGAALDRLRRGWDDARVLSLEPPMSAAPCADVEGAVHCAFRFVGVHIAYHAHASLWDSAYLVDRSHYKKYKRDSKYKGREGTRAHLRPCASAAAVGALLEAVDAGSRVEAECGARLREAALNGFLCALADALLSPAARGGELRAFTHEDGDGLREEVARVKELFRDVPAVESMVAPLDEVVALMGEPTPALIRTIRSGGVPADLPKTGSVCCTRVLDRILALRKDADAKKWQKRRR